MMKPYDAMMRLFSSQILLKLLSLLSVGLTIAAFVVWRQTGVPAPWLIRAAAAVFGAALLAGLIDQDTRPRMMLRFLAALFALVAVIACASDLTRYGPGGPQFAATALRDHIMELSPSLFAGLRSTVSKAAGAAAWDGVALGFLSLPTFLIFGLLAAIAGYAGRPRERVRIFVN